MQIGPAGDAAFDFFLNGKGFGPAVQRRPVSTKEIDRYRGKLPDQLLRYWTSYGWSGFGNGILWMVDPSEYQPILDRWLADLPTSDDYSVFARSAFGKMFVWGRRTGNSLTIDCPAGLLFRTDRSKEVASGQSDTLLQAFFAGVSKRNLDCYDSGGQPLFERALRTLGQLSWDQMYGFEPALALGGPVELGHLNTLKVVEHLQFLGQVGEKRLMGDVVRDARSAGLL